MSIAMINLHEEGMFLSYFEWREIAINGKCVLLQIAIYSLANVNELHSSNDTTLTNCNFGMQTTN